MSNLAELIKQQSREAYESLIGPETQRQWDEVMEKITAAAAEGRHSVTWTESGEYLADYTNEVRHDATNEVLKRLEAEGFRVYTERCAYKGGGAGIYW